MFKHISIFPISDAEGDLTYQSPLVFNIWKEKENCDIWNSVEQTGLFNLDMATSLGEGKPVFNIWNSVEQTGFFNHMATNLVEGKLELTLIFVIIFFLLLGKKFFYLVTI